MATTTTSGTVSAEEKRWELQKTLHLLLHAHKCQQRDKDSGSNGCTVPRCLSMKNNLKHMAECLDNKTCKGGVFGCFGDSVDEWVVWGFDGWLG